MFKNMKVAVRMGLGFGMVIVVMIALIMVSLNQMEATANKLDLIVTRNVVRVHYANNMIDNVKQVSINIRNILLLKDIRNTEATIKMIAEGRQKYDEGLKFVEDLTTKDNQKGLEIISEIKNFRNAARALNNKVIDLALAEKYDESAALLIKEAAPAVLQWLRHVEDLIKHSEDRIKLRYDEAQKAQNTARTNMIILGCASIALATLMIILLTSSITGPLGRSVQMMREIVQGHLGTRLKMDRRDEIGILASNMDQFAEDLQQVFDKIKTVVGGNLSVQHAPKDSRDEIAPVVNEQLVVELYSK